MRYLLAGVLVVAAAGCRPDLAGMESPATGKLAKETPAESAVEQPGELTKEEAAFLQGVCEEGIATRIEPKHHGDFPHRGVALRTMVAELHKKKRVAMLRFLLGVVKDARPNDALTAGVTALALEEGSVYALCVWDETANAFDETRATGEPTKREWLVKKLGKTLANAEAGQEPAGQDE